jgi:tripartite-type tricarboxylate transporter receptor subunit TctC
MPGRKLRQWLMMIAATVLLYASTAASAFEQSFPTAPVRFVVSTPAGGVNDLIARLVADGLSARWSQPVIVDNRPGASGLVAMRYVANAAPDGYTIILSSESNHILLPLLDKNFPLDVFKDFVPISLSGQFQHTLIVKKETPVATVQELISYLKAHPGKLSFGSSGAGSFFHLAGELFNQVSGVNLAHVPYRGSVAAFTDLIGGHIQVNFTQLSQAVAYRDNPNLKVLAVLEETRFSRWPEYPSITETLPSYKMPPTWNGIVGPAGLPEPILQRLNGEFNKALNLSEVKRRLED